MISRQHARRILSVSDYRDRYGGYGRIAKLRSEMSSTDVTTIGVHRALHEALNSAREARHHLEDGEATPDLDDLVELGKLVASLSEAVMAVNAEMAAKARQAKNA
jgi:hypothetical protein